MEYEINESPFAGIANTLKKYGGSERIKDEPKKVAPKRSAFHGDISLTGHKEKINKDGSRSYSKVLPDYDDDTEVKTVAAVQKDVAKQTGAAEPVKRGRGRPKGVGAKAGSYKPRDPAKKAASAAKAAATKAANKAARAALTKEDLDECLEGLDFNGLVDFMMSEDVQSMDSTNKQALAAYVRSSLTEASDTEVRDPKTGKLISWKHEGDWKNAKGTVTDKSGAKHDGNSRARHLARQAIAKEKINKNVNESVSNMDRYSSAVSKGVFSKLAR